ncbi:hypothetical protein [Marinomonas sp. TW1]|uniref:hypothetical protein n=1 Tax=Marinomonas sp. TW1 TaxID=1561203 RepID=UPI0007AEF78A|nr:hypothetical protein [Marinomonas sp. TW1]KZN12420.1 cysteine desulfhydrase [Marinomonas sp. TW1]
MSLIQSINLNFLGASKLNQTYQLDIYRGDLEHAKAPGNKWHKLRHHLKAAEQQNAKYIGSLGGPYSNHLHALAASLADRDEQAILLVRGELQAGLTPTLQDAVADGAELWPSQRSDFRLGLEADVVKHISQLYPAIYWVPEGGGGVLGAEGCADWANTIGAISGQYSAWAIAAGTGTTAAGILSSEACPKLEVFSALKGMAQQRVEIISLAANIAKQEDDLQHISDRLGFHDDAHLGGYAKLPLELTMFLKAFFEANPYVELDPVYTSKVFFSLWHKMKNGAWPHAKTLMIHTGGMQGWRGYASHQTPF